MEFYILKLNDSYITTTVIDNNSIRHNTTDVVEHARRYDNLTTAKKHAKLFDCKVTKVTISKEEVKE